MNPAILLPWLLLAALLALVLRGYLWRAILFVAPGSAKVRALDGGLESMPPELARKASELLSLGFQPIGAHEEKPSLGPRLRCQDFHRPEGDVYATLYLGPRGQARAYFLSAAPSASLLLTADHAIPAADDATYRAAWLNAPLARVLQAHRRRPASSTSPPSTSRLTLARSFYGAAGAKELRRQHAIGLLWVLAAVLALLLAILPR